MVTIKKFSSAFPFAFYKFHIERTAYMSKGNRLAFMEIQLSVKNFVFNISTIFFIISHFLQCVSMRKKRVGNDVMGKLENKFVIDKLTNN